MFVVKRRYVLPLIVSSIFVMSEGCKNSQRSSGAKAIIGADDRMQVTDKGLIGSVGVLSIGDSSCDAVLIAPDKIATVEHCFGIRALQYGGAKFKNGTGLEATVTNILGFEPDSDRVIYRVDRNFDTYFEATDKPLTKGDRIRVLGHDYNSKTVLISECSVQGTDDSFGVSYYSCDTVPGMSGSAILSNGRFAGLHLGYLGDKKQNVGKDWRVATKGDVKRLSDHLELEIRFKIPTKLEDIGVHIRIDPIPPITIPGMNPQWTGFLLGGPVGALINDRLEAQKRINEMRAANANAEAELLQLKLQLSDQGSQVAALKDQLQCQLAKDSVSSAMDALWQNFKTQIENCSGGSECNNVWEQYRSTTDALFNSSKAMCR